MVTLAQLEVIEGRQHVASFMEVIFRVNVVNQMSAPTSASVVQVYDLTNGSDVTTSIAASTVATIEDTTYVKLAKLSSFTAETEYSVRFSFATTDNKLGGEIRLGCPF